MLSTVYGELMKSINQRICEYVSANPLCFTRDVAEHIGRSASATAKTMHLLERRDSLRVPIKQGDLNRWVLGTHQDFRPARPDLSLIANGNGGGHVYPKTGNIDFKRVVTVAANAEDALALLGHGFNKVKVSTPLD